MPLTFSPPTAARDDLDGLLLGGQPSVENLVADAEINLYIRRTTCGE